MRTCGHKGNMCTLCCKLLPMTSDPEVRGNALWTGDLMVRSGMATTKELSKSIPDFDKKAGCDCPHQRHHTGCKIYKRRPFGCRFWTCRWLAEDDTQDLPRPDYAHYVIDSQPDFVKATNGAVIKVIQIWCDPAYPHAHRDRRLREYLKRQFQKFGFQAIIRYNERDSIFVYYDGIMFHEKTTELAFEKTHTGEEIRNAIGSYDLSITLGKTK